MVDSKDPAIPLELSQSQLVVSFTLPDMVWLRVTDMLDRTVIPKEISVTWLDDGEGWQLFKVDVRGKRDKKTGGHGNPIPITVFDLKQFPTDVRDQINAQAPTGYSENDSTESEEG
ncbi:hypothetical protein ACFRAQ_34825 [Nocardia sp. NPDC056611]|uniref:hypothetical protein n=1 Tax=Nocardia sp. NPDC056611 TaxID=3345877 RepID=UPI00367287DC